MATPSAAFLAFRERIAEARAQQLAAQAEETATASETESTGGTTVVVSQEASSTAPAQEAEAEAEAPVETSSSGGSRSSSISVEATQSGDGEPVVTVDDNSNGNGSFVVTSGQAGSAPTGSGTIVESIIVEIGANSQPEPEVVEGETFEGGDGRDRFRGTDGNDVINGNGGNDIIRGGDGDDTLSGGEGRDLIIGGFGDDTFIYNEGDGFDRLRNFDLLGDDVLQLDIDGINSVEDFLGALTSVRDVGDAVSATFDFGGGDRLNIVLDAVENLTEEDFIFV